MYNYKNPEAVISAVKAALAKELGEGFKITAEIHNYYDYEWDGSSCPSSYQSGYIDEVRVSVYFAESDEMEDYPISSEDFQPPDENLDQETLEEIKLFALACKG
jgi:hypothetical protein